MCLSCLGCFFFRSVCTFGDGIGARVKGFGTGSFSEEELITQLLELDSSSDRINRLEGVVESNVVEHVDPDHRSGHPTSPSLNLTSRVESLTVEVFMVRSRAVL